MATNWRHDFERLYIITGPAFDETQEDFRNIEIPDAYWKIIAAYDDGQVFAVGLFFPETYEESQPIESYLVSIDYIEQATGLDFFHEMPDASEIPFESRVASGIWP